jgi:hypothetical protein
MIGVCRNPARKSGIAGFCHSGKSPELPDFALPDPDFEKHLKLAHNSVIKSNDNSTKSRILTKMFAD